MSREITYVVRRHGSNGANQPMTPVMALGLVTASNRAEAEAKASEIHTCYANQQLELVPASRASQGEINEAIENDAAREQTETGFCL